MSFNIRLHIRTHVFCITFLLSGRMLPTGYCLPKSSLISFICSQTQQIKWMPLQIFGAFDLRFHWILHSSQQFDFFSLFLFSFNSYNLMYACWNVNPGERPTFSEIIKIIEDFLNDEPERQIETVLGVPNLEW